MTNYEKRGYLLENFRLFHLRTEQAPSVDFHYHEFCKLLFLVSGRGSYTVEGRRYQLRSGDIVCIDSRSVHKPELLPDTPYERIILFISPAFLQRESTEDCSLVENFSGEDGHVLRLKEPARKKLFDMAEILEKELNKEEYGRSIASSAALLRLLVQIGREKRRGNVKALQAQAPENKRVLEIMEYLDHNLAEDIDIDRLAERFFISKFYMMRLFHRETGTTVYGYLTQKRLLKARALMDSGMRATESCYACGFRSYSSFTRAYGKYFGTTPTGRADPALVRSEVAE